MRSFWKRFGIVGSVASLGIVALMAFATPTEVHAFGEELWAVVGQAAIKGAIEGSKYKNTRAYAETVLKDIEKRSCPPAFKPCQQVKQRKIQEQRDKIKRIDRDKENIDRRAKKAEQIYKKIFEPFDGKVIQK